MNEKKRDAFGSIDEACGSILGFIREARREEFIDVLECVDAFFGIAIDVPLHRVVTELRKRLDDDVSKRPSSERLGEVVRRHLFAGVVHDSVGLRAVCNETLTVAEWEDCVYAFKWGERMQAGSVFHDREYEVTRLAIPYEGIKEGDRLTLDEATRLMFQVYDVVREEIKHGRRKVK